MKIYLKPELKIDNLTFIDVMTASGENQTLEKDNKEQTAQSLFALFD